ncbi:MULTISPECIES: efflux transporter outer membrane subunit [unclassified Paraburkholderia]|uniref:efflux transporter outer membrane subunit n=1 Tax=unclassified Paraburkholderia TaxID=2615204 RepID=UPI00288C003B|nr:MULTISPECIES: efflux transporter outer membrane subunit [unclassified Paraburkholderia]
MRTSKTTKNIHPKYNGRPSVAQGRAAPLASLSLAALLAFETMLAGCTVGPNYTAPSTPTVSKFTEKPVPARTVSADTTAGTAQTLVEGRDIQGDWWALFHSPQINALVERALKANPTLAAAQATLREARENTRAEQGSFFPQISASTSAERERNSLVSPVPKTYNVISGSLSVSYTLDAFGGVRRQVEQLNAQAEYERYELEATELTLIANVVNAAINEASLQAQIDTTHEIIRAYTAALDVTRYRFEAGGVSQVDVLQQQSLLDAQIATLPGLQKQLEQQRNQLAVYLGGLPTDYTGFTLDLASLVLPEELPVSLPSSLVAQRPDIQAYGALLHSATANVGIAVANMLPQISLTGSYGRDGSSYSNLFNPAGIVWSLAGSLTQPVFEGGTLKAKKRAADAAVDVAAAQYSSTVNSAFQDVANALVAIHRDAETLAANLETQKTAAASLRVAQAQYRAGGGTYLNVLSAEQSDQSARLNLISSQATRYTDTVALFQALGGGWWHRNDVDPKVAQCCGAF